MATSLRSVAWRRLCPQSTHFPATTWCVSVPPPEHPTIQKFLRNGGHVDARNKDTLWTLLHTASHTGQHRVVELLVSAGARLEIEVEGRYNPLLLCCSCGSNENAVCPVERSDPSEEDIEDPDHSDECGHVKVSAKIPVVRCSGRACSVGGRKTLPGARYAHSLPTGGCCQPS